MTKPIELTDANFQSEVLNATGPVMVDLWAPWCPPCRAVAPAIDALAGQYAGRAKVGKLNVDGNPQTPENFDVSSIPTVLLFKDGQLVERLEGAQSPGRYRQALDAAAA